MNSLEISQNLLKDVSNIPNNVSNGEVISNPLLSAPQRGPGQSGVRRTRIPHPMVGNEGQLASFLRNNIGKDLSKVTFPISFNEPISILQRQAEDMEYVYLLERAVATKDPIERIALIATFSISGYACTRYRPGRKPFNSVLGETFEDHRTNFVAEKVCHHPTVLACHAHGHGWEYWSTAEVASSFTGKSMKLELIGWSHVKIGQDHYRWDKPPSYLRNIILGDDKYFEHVGPMTVEEARTGLSVEIEFKEKTFWKKSDANAVEGTILSVDEIPRGSIKGTWDEQIIFTRASSHPRRLWQVNPYPHEASRFYGFTYFAASLNEILPTESFNLPNTDSRRRPDQRLMEEGRLEDAEAEKHRIEELQRDRRRRGADRKPRWFRCVRNGSDGGGQEWEYVGGYWEARESPWKDVGEPLW